MNKYFGLLILIFCCSFHAKSQGILPKISVINMNGKVIVSWKNQYPKPIANLTIQRSYDSLRNYTTIGEVLNPQAEENGYTDNNPPYGRMYYRVFVAFEGGAYVITEPVKASKTLTTSEVDSVAIIYPWTDTSTTIGTQPEVKPGELPLSKNVYSAPDNSIVLHLINAPNKKFKLKIFDQRNNKLVMELTNLKEEYLILEKMNFPHSGWYNFELYNGEELIEKNKFEVRRENKQGKF